MPTLLQSKAPAISLVSLTIRDKFGRTRVVKTQSEIAAAIRMFNGRIMSRPETSRARPKSLTVRKWRSPGAATLLDAANFGRHLATNPASDSPAAVPTVEYVQSIKDAEGGAWSTAEFVERAKISRQALQERRDTFAIVYWTDAKGHCHYPKWQFDSDLQVFPHVRTILTVLHTHDTLRVLTTFLVPSIGEPGTSALKLIHAGRGEEAVAAVRSREDER